MYVSTSRSPTVVTLLSTGRWSRRNREPVVLLANEFEDLLVECQDAVDVLLHDRAGHPRAGVFRGDLDLEMRHVRTLHALDDMHLVGMDRTDLHLVVEADRVHDERVTLPLSDRVALPRRIPVLGMRSPIQENLAKAGGRLFGDVDERRRGLHELEYVIPPGLGGWQTDPRA